MRNASASLRPCVCISTPLARSTRLRVSSVSRRSFASFSRVRGFCARSLDPLVGTGRFDFVRDLGAQMPMRVIGMLLGIPEADQEAIRDRVDANLRTEPGKAMEVEEGGTTVLTVTGTLGAYFSHAGLKSPTAMTLGTPRTPRS